MATYTGSDKRLAYLFEHGGGGSGGGGGQSWHAAWTSTGSSALNTQLTNAVTITEPGKYLAVVNIPPISNGNIEDFPLKLYTGNSDPYGAGYELIEPMTVTDRGFAIFVFSITSNNVPIAVYACAGSNLVTYWNENQLFRGGLDVFSIAGGIYVEANPSSGDVYDSLRRLQIGNKIYSVGGSSGGGVNYSTSEQNTGLTWIDGRTIYQKTVDCGTLPNNTDKNVAHGISNLDYVIHCYGVAKRPAAGSTVMNNLLLPYSHQTSANNIALSVNSTNITIRTGNDRTAFTSSYVTIEYVKAN